MKKLLSNSMLLAVLMLFTGIPASAYDFISDGIPYNILSEEDRTVEVTYLSYEKSWKSGDVVIPKKVMVNSKTYTVTAIGGVAFKNCDEITSITLPNSLTEIEGAAFRGCTSLTSITLPNSLTEIGQWAFNGCTSLTSITLPNSLTSIGESAFYKCTSLTSITLSKSLTKIGESAFEGCTELENIMNQSAVPVECNPKFADEVLKNAVLYVPTGTLAEYEKVDPWRNFWNIEEMDFSGIEEIEAGNDSDIRLTVNGGVLTIDGIDSGENIAVYDMQGRCVYCGSDRCIDNLAAGIYIIRAGHKILKFAI